MRLKRWESPRRSGRNDKGKGGSARQRQLKKQQQMMRKKLKGETIQSQKQTRKSRQNSNTTQQEGRDVYSLPFFDFLAQKDNQEIRTYKRIARSL